MIDRQVLNAMHRESSIHRADWLPEIGRRGALPPPADPRAAVRTNLAAALGLFAHWKGLGAVRQGDVRLLLCRRPERIIRMDVALFTRPGLPA